MSYNVVDQFKQGLQYHFDPDAGGATDVYVVPPARANPDGVEDGSSLHPYTNLQDAVDALPAYNAADLTTFTGTIWALGGIYDPGASVPLTISRGGATIINCHGSVYFGETAWLPLFITALQTGVPPPPLTYTCDIIVGDAVSPAPADPCTVIVRPAVTAPPTDTDSISGVFALLSGSFICTGKVYFIGTSYNGDAGLLLESMLFPNPAEVQTGIRCAALFKGPLTVSGNVIRMESSGVYVGPAVTSSTILLKDSNVLNIYGPSFPVVGKHKVNFWDECVVHGDIIYGAAKLSMRSCSVVGDQIEVDHIRARHVHIDLAAPSTIKNTCTLSDTRLEDCSVTSSGPGISWVLPDAFNPYIYVDGVSNYLSDWTTLPVPNKVLMT